MRGTVLGLSDDGDMKMLAVQFDSPGAGWHRKNGRWNVLPTDISRTKLAPEDIVWLSLCLDEFCADKS